MEAIIIIASIFVLIVFYFSFGMIIKLLWGWLPLILGVLIGIIITMLMSGWAGALIGISIITFAISATNVWQGSEIFITVEESIEKIFYLDD